MGILYSIISAAAWTSTVSVPISPDLGECILLFGAYANGNMGDVIQSSTMARLVSNVAPDTCVWHAHPSKESVVNGFHEGEFFGNNSAGLLPLGCDRESGEQVSRFKAFVIGGGGLFEAKHWPLDCQNFVNGLRDDLPVAIFGVGASLYASKSAPIIRRANYLAGRDDKSVRELSALVGKMKTAKSRPEDVRMVRDPVLSDSYYTDVAGKCWRKGDEGKKPLCFVLPSAMKENLQHLHRIYSSQVVREGDVLLNVFPKHQAEIQAYPYPTLVEPVLDPAQFALRLCDCRAVVSSRLHGVILALQAGVPTIAAWPAAEGNKVPDLMKDVMRLRDQFVLVDFSLTRTELERKIEEIRQRYSAGRRSRVFEKLAIIALNTQQESAHMLSSVAGLQLSVGIDSSSGRRAGDFWVEMDHTHDVPGKPEDEVGVAKETAVVAAGPRVELDAESRPPEGIGSPWMRLRKTWRLGVSPLAPTVVGGELPFARSVYMAWIALAITAFLGLPSLAYRSRSESASPPQTNGSDFAFGKSPGLPEGGFEVSPLAKPPVFGAHFGGNPLRPSDLVFFGLNYVLWIVMSLGFSVCSKTYLLETGNPAALLAIQGWVGVGVLFAMNLALWLMRRGRSSPPTSYSSISCSATSADSCSSPASSLPSRSFRLVRLFNSAEPLWAGHCGLREARRLGKGVWQAGLLHSFNALLTSWLILLGGVAATYALKGLEPVAAAGFSRWLLGSSLPPGRAVAVLIIMLGLVILMVPLHFPVWASGSSDSSSGEGRRAGALMGKGQDLAFPAVITALACCAVALRNVLLKKPDPPPPPPPLGLLACSIVGAVVGSMTLLVPWLPWSWEWAKEPLLRTSGVNAALCFVAYNLASFNLLSELSPVGHAVGSASKCVFLFSSGLLLLGEEGSMSLTQLAGVSVAFVGFSTYNLAGAVVTFASPSSR